MHQRYLLPQTEDIFERSRETADLRHSDRNPGRSPEPHVYVTPPRFDSHETPVRCLATRSTSDSSCHGLSSVWSVYLASLTVMVTILVSHRPREPTGTTHKAEDRPSLSVLPTTRVVVKTELSLPSGQESWTSLQYNT